MTVSWDDEIPNKWKVIKFHGSSHHQAVFIPLNPPLSHEKIAKRHPRLIQGRDRPRKGEAISGGGFVARHRGPQPIPRRDTGHKLLLRVAFEPPTGKQKDGKVLLDTTNPPKKDAIFTCFYFFKWIYTRDAIFIVFTFLNGSILGMRFLLFLLF